MEVQDNPGWVSVPEQVGFPKLCVTLFSHDHPVSVLCQDDEWLKFVACLKQCSIPAGASLSRNQKMHGCHIMLLSGTVRYYLQAPNGRQLTLYRTIPGDLCIHSLSRFFSSSGLDVEAVTDTRVTVMGIPTADFDHFFSISESFRNYILGSILKHVQALTNLVNQTTFGELCGRLANRLIELFELRDTIRLKITHQQLAHEIGSTREVVSRILEEFKHSGSIELSRNCIELVSRERLGTMTANKQ